MKREIIIHRLNGQLMGALTEDGHLCEYWRQGEIELAGQIYKGRVERVVPGMKAAFVDLGLDKNGFLPLDEGGDDCPLQTGQEIIVQIKKAPQGTKGAFLTREISLAGEYVLVLPVTQRIGVSKRVNDPLERERLHQLAQALKKETGLIMRANSLEADVSRIQQEIDTLCGVWQDLKTVANGHNAPYPLSNGNTHAQRLLRDYVSRMHKLVTDDADIYDQYKDLVECQLYEGETDLFAIYNIPKQLEQALHPKVWLKSGGYLVIDPCEALTVIDVNTGKFTGKRLLEETILKLNMEACEMIARQVRLRSLAGIILIDFIDMETQEHRDKVAEALRNAFKEDRQKTVLHGFTSLGLMEMTRKKDQPPLKQWLSTPCRHCHGLGYLKGDDETHA